MKKLSILFLLFTANLFAQTGNIKVFIGCYADKDSITPAYLNSQSGINLLSTMASEDYVVSSYEMILNSKGTMNTFKFDNSSFFAKSIFNPVKAAKEGDKISIQNIKVLRKNAVSGKYTEIKIEPATFYVAKSNSKNCKDQKRFPGSHKPFAKAQLSCFGEGDIASLKDVLKQPYLSLVEVDPEYTVELVSYMVYTQFGTEPRCAKCAEDKLSPSFLGSLNEGKALSDVAIVCIKRCDSASALSFIHVNDILVDVVNRKSGEKSKQKLSPFTINIAKESVKNCSGNTGQKAVRSKVDYAGKLLAGKEMDQPLANQKVVLQDANNREIQSTLSDKYGDFKFKELSLDLSYKIAVEIAEDTKIRDGVLYIAKQDGTVINVFGMVENTFVYELLPAELTALARMEEQDIGLRIKNFGVSKELLLTVTENIYYDENSAEISLSASAILDKIISEMISNTNLKLSVSSHTDAKGREEFNLSLSETRAQKVLSYFVSKGVDRSRITAKGFGETQLKNRCKKNVDCSEMEHQLNRRTEFRFTK